MFLAFMFSALIIVLAHINDFSEQSHLFCHVFKIPPRRSDVVSFINEEPPVLELTCPKKFGSVKISCSARKQAQLKIERYIFSCENYQLTPLLILYCVFSFLSTNIKEISPLYDYNKMF